MLFRTIIKECVLLLGLATITAFAVNFFSPAGIAFWGEWDPSRGVISAKPKNDVVVQEREIDDMESAKVIFDEGEALFVDARDSATYKEGHIRGAISLPVNEFDNRIEQFIENYPASRFIVVYCSGRECEDSHALAQYLSEMGYDRIKVFIDGYAGWKKEAFPIESETEAAAR